jgi:L-amino acid N-acyltransferase YncA
MLMVDPVEYIRDLDRFVVQSGGVHVGHQLTVSAILVGESRPVAGALVDGNSLSYFVRNDMWQCGIGFEFITTLCQGLSQCFHLTSLDASVLRDNVASRKILERVGFKFTGLAHLRGPTNSRHAVLHYTKTM